MTALPSPLDLPIPYTVNFDAPHCESCLSPNVHARGLCNGCYEHRLRNGLIGMYPRRYMRPAEVAVEVEHLRLAGVPERELPARLGMSRGGLLRSLQRARG